MSSLAPCIAVVGPANSGKTTLLHLLDRALQRHPSRPLAYIVKGSPDGTGRYLFHAPELRDALKADVKGKWIRETSATVASWIAHSRTHLDLVLLDFGGKHGPDDDYMLQHCSHFIVLARSFDDPVREAASGMASWIDTCKTNGLHPVARLRSIVGSGEAAVHPAEPGVVEGTFRGDAARPEDTANTPMIAALVEHLLALRQPRARPTYLDLKLPRDWTVADLADLGGRAPELERLVDAEGSLVLGGAAPGWAYSAALHRALDRNPEARIEQFDPKAPGGLVEIPRVLSPDPSSPLARALRVGWETSSGEGMLRIEIATDDKMLPPMAFQLLPGAPLPAGPLPDGPLWTSGPGPIWLHLAYGRWLRRCAGDRALGAWDGRMRGIVFVTGASAPRFEPRELPGARAGASRT